MMEKKWEEVDVLYAIGIILVVLGHSHVSDWSFFSGTAVESMISFIYVFHMPLFFFIAGFLFCNSDSLSKKGFAKWICDKVTRLMTPYIVLSVLAILPKYYFENHSLAGIAEFGVKALLIPRIGVWGHFWFLPTLLAIYVIFGFLENIFDLKQNEGLLFLVLALSCLVFFLPQGSQWFAISDIQKHAVYFVLGIAIYRLQEKIDCRENKLIMSIIAVLGIVVSIMCVHYYLDIKWTMFLISILMICVCCNIAVFVRNSEKLKWVGKNCFTIYLYSWPFQSVMMVMVQRLGFNLLLTTVSMFVIGLMGPILLLIIYKKQRIVRNRILDLLVGIR